jgi:hypothetical protein
MATMKSSKERIVKTVIHTLFIATLVLCYSACSALTLVDSNATGKVIGQLSSVVYKFIEVNAAPASRLPTETELIEVEQGHFRSKIFHVDSRIVANTFNNNIVAHDSATFTLNSGNRAVNNALSLIGTVSQTAISNDTTKLIQVLALLAKREAKVDFSYVAPMSKNSRIESHIDCRLYNAGVSKVATLARVEYRVDF